MLSVIPAIIGEIFLGVFWQALGFSVVAVSLISVAIDAPFVEELCKPLGLTFVRLDINTRLDGLIYGVTAGMGFAMIENLLYEIIALVGPIIEFFIDSGSGGELAISVSSSWGFTSLIRGLGSTIGHAIGAGMIGMAYFQYRNSNGQNIFPLISAFCFAVIIHMTWNGVLSILDLFQPHEVFYIAFIVIFPLVELYILIHLIKICKREEPKTVFPKDDNDLFDQHPPGPPSRPAFSRPPAYAQWHKPPKERYPRSPPPTQSPGHEPEWLTCPSCGAIAHRPPPQYGNIMRCPSCNFIFRWK
jgi:RsiW-degrading membrane proteinase PrsW (M82 family)